MDLPTRGLLSEELAAIYTGRPASTIRRWAAEGRIQRYGSGRGKVRYSAYELPGKTVDNWTGVTTLGPPPKLPAGARAA
ncbi:helix-turn-helix domain-containing protein [Streptomyces virginiae]